MAEQITAEKWTREDVRKRGKIIQKKKIQKKITLFVKQNRRDYKRIPHKTYQDIKKKRDTIDSQKM